MKNFRPAALDLLCESLLKSLGLVRLVQTSHLSEDQFLLISKMVRHALESPLDEALSLIEPNMALYCDGAGHLRFTSVQVTSTDVEHKMLAILTPLEE